jgi:hypothetical protein
MLRSYLQKVKDVRRKQGQRYDLGNILLLSILAILSGAVSYRKIQAFISVHFELLKVVFDIKWKRVPAYTTIRKILQRVDAGSLESAFREYSQELDSKAGEDRRVIACDGKTLKGSFDRFQDQRAVQLFSFFNVDSQIILAHEEIAEKGHEIPAFQGLIKSLGISGCIFTGDAIHCQKKL